MEIREACKKCNHLFFYSWYIGFTVKLFCALDFSNYPLDEQTCYFKIGSTGFTKDEITFSSGCLFDDYKRPTNYDVRLFLNNKFHQIKCQIIILTFLGISRFYRELYKSTLSVKCKQYFHTSVFLTFFTSL